MNKITVSEIASLLYYDAFQLPPEYVLKRGKWIHLRLGYDNVELFQRFFVHKGKTWVVRGAPDKIDREEGVVRELKTYSNATAKKRVREVANCQANIYCWLIGVPRYCVDLYDVKEDKMEKECKPYEEKRAIKDIVKGIRLKEYKENLKKKFYEKRKKISER